MGGGHWNHIVLRQSDISPLKLQGGIKGCDQTEKWRHGGVT